MCLWLNNLSGWKHKPVLFGPVLTIFDLYPKRKLKAKEIKVNIIKNKPALVQKVDTGKLCTLLFDKEEEKRNSNQINRIKKESL